VLKYASLGGSLVVSTFDEANALTKTSSPLRQITSCFSLFRTTLSVFVVGLRKDVNVSADMFCRVLRTACWSRMDPLSEQATSLELMPL
jgi:hypothetical protein